MRFKKGQQVVCTRPNTPWNSTGGYTHLYGPKYNEVVTVSGPGISEDFIRLREYPCNNGVSQSYHERWFEPLITDAELAEQLETVQMLCPSLHKGLEN